MWDGIPLHDFAVGDMYLKEKNVITLQQGRGNRGINPTDWIPFAKTLYDDCADPKNYFPKGK